MPISFYITVAASTGFWLWAERAAVLLAGFASLLAVYLGRVAIEDARKERKRAERSRASTVLSTAGLMRRRMVGLWGTSVPAEGAWPDGSKFDVWLESIELDRQLADQLQERCVGIDIEAANYAELAWRYVNDIQFTLSEALRSWKRHVGGRGNVPVHVQQMWDADRLRLASAIEGTITVLDSIERMFPPDVQTVQGVPRNEHLFQTDERIRKTSEATARERIRTNAYGGSGLWEPRDPSCQ